MTKSFEESCTCVKMTDFKEEQRNEVEALESIYPDEISVLQTEPYHIFTIDIRSQETEDEDDEYASCTIQFTYVEEYPDTPPVFEITNSENLEDDQLDTVNEIITSNIEESLGMVMVFTIVSAVQEKLSDLVEESKKRKQEELERKKKEQDELEQKKFEGTRVTIESFLAWKNKFDAEMLELKKLKNEEIQGPKGLTGKEMFMKDSSMIDSDVKFLTEEDTVEVDESLFQDMDDLDLDDNDLDLEETAVD